ncbi:calcium uptake protein 3, mitochondrial-like isoform X2 [Limulus polyphemus]|uniref:Calcium uptake protein 3, mitochondrial-like isoform X2 n=1 Tax=Limulus polyphemus TaxID=6850 RepID=A0ABM1BDD5_LIMPO|nr:calcium uptake protein 3, mitochondrial-like isoform X2 [Limulus polyphemus]
MTMYGNLYKVTSCYVRKLKSGIDFLGKRYRNIADVYFQFQRHESFSGSSYKFNAFKKNAFTKHATVGFGSISLVIGLWALRNKIPSSDYFVLHAKQNVHLPLDNSKGQKLEQQLTSREKRFVKFASVEYRGQIYMTPQDFLESVTETEPRPRLRRRRLTQKDLEYIQEVTPSRNKGNTKLFRSLHDIGIISYTEYLFLLSVLTKPQSGFHIAFNMFDTDGNKKVDKKEFLVVQHVVVSSLFRRTSGKLGLYTGVQPKLLEQIFSKVARNTLKKTEEKTNNSQLDDSLASMAVNTTLLVHLFGKKGKETLCFDDFYRFMDNLQTEVLELEFMEFSHGMPTISEVDFASILLRYTYVHSDDYEAYIQRVQEQIPEEKGITFEQFKAFCQFLNNLDEFAIAMRMFTFANQPISQEEFHRAVKICTGHNLDKNLVNTVFQVFDSDGDGHLSYKEFIAIMRDRLHRGFRSHLVKNEGWEAFKTCVKNEMKS